MIRRNPVQPPPPDLRPQVEKLQDALRAARYALNRANDYVGARPEPGIDHKAMIALFTDTLACVAAPCPDDPAGHRSTGGAVMELRAPFPYFGGKREAAPLVWSALGNVTNYVEPFFGSGAVLLQRPGGAGRVETVNDKDGLLANVWRAMRVAPDEVAAHADWPVNEADLVARHLWLCGQRDTLTERLMADPEYFDAKAAGWWVWGASQWIGSGWCSGAGGWTLQEGSLVRAPSREADRKRPRLDNGSGVHRRTVSLKRPSAHHQGSGAHAPAVARQVPDLSSDGHGATLGTRRGGLVAWFANLSARLRHVRVCCGDWTRVLGPSTTWKNLTVVRYSGDGICGIFFDPPYSGEVRKKGLYAIDSASVAEQVRAWCAENGANEKLRIVLAGYSGEGHEALLPLGWRESAWAPRGFFRGGYGNQRQASQRHRERLWLSPHCLQGSQQLDLWGVGS